MNVLVTGAAGFIGMHLSLRLIDLGHNVIGVDSLNDYYDVQLKKDRLEILSSHSTFQFFQSDISDYQKMYTIVSEYKIKIIFNLAAQAGVRYSIDNPKAYIDSNINGFFSILEVCRNLGVEKLIYASSSSVYGNSSKEFFSENDNVDNPVSLYAATKKSNELMAHAYSDLFKFQTIGLRFFTVYGPWGRPDMAYFNFVNSLKNNLKIKIFNNGELYRDFTYVDDIIDGIIATINYNKKNYNVFNLGNNKPVKLIDFISIIEKLYGKNFIKEFVEMQVGDVYKTAADLNQSFSELNYNPKFQIEDGLLKFISWHKSYFK